jgi:hypothetical protein
MTNEELGKLFKDSVSAGVKDALKAVGVTSTKTRSKKTGAAGKTGNELVEEHEKYFEALNKSQKLEEEIIERTNKTRKKGVEIQKEKIAYLEEEKQANLRLLRSGKLSEDQMKKAVQNIESINEALEKQNKVLERLERQSRSTFEKIGDISSKVNKGLKAIGADAFSLKGMTDYVKKLDSVGAAFTKNTGIGRRYMREMREQQEQFGKTYGTTLEEASRGYQELSLSLINFNNLSENSRKNIFEQSIVFDQLGQSYQQTSNNINELNTTLGMTTDQSFKLQKDLGQVAVALGMSVSDINNKFISSLNRLSIYGSGAKEQFLRIQTFAKATNIEMGTLTDLTDKLSTFEASGEFAGRLNAIAGMDLFDVGTLTTLEGEDKLRYIADRLKAADFNLDDPKMMRVIKEATGLDANTFRQLSGLNVGKIADMNAAMAKETARGPAELNKRAAEAATQAGKIAGATEAAQSREEKFTGAFDKYVGATNFLIDRIENLTGGQATLVGATVTLTGAISSLSSVFKSQKGGGGGALDTLADVADITKLSKFGKLGKYAKFGKFATRLGVAGTLASGAMEGYETYKQTGDAKKGLIKGGSSAAGAALGGFAGSFIPIPVVGTLAGAYLGEKLGSMVGDYINKEPIDVQDSAAIPGRPLIKTAAGQLLRAKESDAVFTVDMNAAKSGTKQSDDSLTTAVKQLVQAITTSSKEIVLTIDGKTLQRVAFQEFTPRYAG